MLVSSLKTPTTQHKLSVARTLRDRAKKIPSTEDGKLPEVQHVVDALHMATRTTS